MAHLLAKSAEANLLVNQSTPIFIADAMLGSVARKLRIFGFDTLYNVDINDNEILKIAIDQNRVVLTCDKDLFKRVMKVGAKGVLLNCYDDLEDVVHTLSKCGIFSLYYDVNNSRCSFCNGSLLKKKRIHIKGSVPYQVLKRHRDFFQCELCNKIYWKGTHFASLRNLAKKINIQCKKLLTESESMFSSSHGYKLEYSCKHC